MPPSTFSSTSVWFMRADADSQSVGSIKDGIALLHNELDRSVAIIGGTIVEMTLTAALKAYLHPNTKITDDLFRTTGALGTFATKIDLGFLVGLYGEDAHRDLITTKEIRNRFAHSLAVSDFNSQQIRAWCMNLKLVERHTAQAGTVETVDPPSDSTHWIGIMNRERILADPRERFLLSAQVFCAGLSMARHTRMPPPLF